MKSTATVSRNLRKLVIVQAGAIAFAFTLSLETCTLHAENAPKTSKVSSGLVSGVELENFSKTISASDDFYKHVNGSWLDRTEIPSDQSRWGSFSVLDDMVKEQVKTIIEEAGQNPSAASGPAKQVGDFYRAFTNVEARNTAGLKPIQFLLDEITAIQNKADWSRITAKLDRKGVPGMTATYIDQDAKRSDQYAVHLVQNGLSLPDRDYYLEDEGRYRDALAALETYAKEMLAAAGHDSPESGARAIVAIEKELAKAQWSQVELRDPVKSYNKVAISDFETSYPNLQWRASTRESGLPTDGTLIVGQPSFFQATNDLIESQELSALKAYTTFRLIDAYAEVLTETLEQKHFGFHQTVLSGVTDQEPLWKRGVMACNQTLGMPVGQLYVNKYFPPEAKERMEGLVEGLKAAFAIRIKDLEWMSPGTKKQALEKLAKFTHKIGYPNKWKDYSSVEIDDLDVVKNLMALAEFEHQYALAKLGKPINRDEWGMPPQTVNAYYNPQMNEIVFPAGILQPPFFNLKADDAINYGGIGAVIGHEISHGFDDQGSQYDGDGNLRNWWTQNDRMEFERRAEKLVSQYQSYKPFPDMNVNGKLTLGENIGDLGGLNAAYTAYQLSLNGKQPAIIDGLSGDQRFFTGWAQVWRCKYRETELRKRLLTDPHSPTNYRANGIVSNLDSFYDAFSVKPDSAMYIEQNKRVRLW
jgi:endothelin-converting enzyme/putative endopeptidase